MRAVRPGTTRLLLPSLLSIAACLAAATVPASAGAAVITRTASADTFTASASSTRNYGADTSNLPGWGTPAWRDEFSGTAVDPTKWNVRARADLGLLFDAAEPVREQVSTSNGILHIKGDWLTTPYTRPAGRAGIPVITHKTGYLDHRNLGTGNVSYAQRWGRWEIRAKTPTGPKTLGSLAAFWLRNSNSGEIDIMEAWGYNETAFGAQRINSATTTVHTQTSGTGNQKFFWHHSDHQTTKVVPWDGFHTYAFELTPSYAAVIVDGVQIARATPASHPNLWNETYFGTPLHVRLNLHIGPSVQYWGIPDVNNRSATQPLDFQVDYVRIWPYSP
ncbi:MAG: hypothetical protein JWO69_746 [Thermoleophilia bacterium]|nr:hypothetical protein [Thermoleophilia bacterium]